MAEKWANLIKHSDHTINYGNLEIIVFDGVFTPDSNLTYSTTQTLEYIKKLDVKEKKVLDIGCGTGIIGITCLASGAKTVTFSDVNPKAIENTRLNLKSNNLSDKAEVVQSDLFKNIHGKFDFIFANLPISNEVWLPEISEQTETLVERFLKELPPFVNENGRVIINWGSFASLEELENNLVKFKYKYTKVSEKSLDHDWYIIYIQF